MTWTAIDSLLRWLWQDSYTAHCLDVLMDPLRAVIWTACNLTVALAYFGIPYEIGLWAEKLRLDMGNWLARLFRAFIVYCGVSHVAMIAIMPTTRWAIILLFFLPLAIVSGGVFVILRRNREKILGSIEIVRKLLT